MNRQSLRSDEGAALPLVILMMVLLSLSISATAVLTQSATATVQAHATQKVQRNGLVSWALQESLRDLSPANGRVLGVDPAFDPAGSCQGQLGPYVHPDGRVVRVDCVQASESGWTEAQSSLVLVGDGGVCVATNTCVTGQDGGLRLTSNDPLRFSGTLINAAGAWLGKNANSRLLDASSPRASVLQPKSTDCPANGFDAGIRCTCPTFATNASACRNRELARLQADLAAYFQRLGRSLTTQTAGATAVIPTCATAARINASDPMSPWAITIAGGTIGPTELAKLNALTTGRPCIGDGTTRQAPILQLTGVLRFADSAAGSPMQPGTAAQTGNTWTISVPDAVIVGGAPVIDTTTGIVRDCDPAVSGAMLQFSGASYLRLQSGRMLLCPPSSSKIVIAAPTSDPAAGFAWQGSRTDPLFSTQYGIASGETLRTHGLVFAPAGHFQIDAQSNRTLIALTGGTVLRALTLTSNPSTITQGDFAAPIPTVSGTRDIQLRFWDVSGNRDLGIVQMLIYGDDIANPATGYAFKVWRTMW